jgi:hypothetical protein
VQGGRFFTEFPKLCKGLAIVLFFGHILVQIFPSAATYLALIPARCAFQILNLLRIY